MPGYEENYYAAEDGLRLYYRDYSAASHIAKTPVLCIPGLTRNSRDFDFIAGHMAPSRRVLTADLVPAFARPGTVVDASANYPRLAVGLQTKRLAQISFCFARRPQT